MESLAEQARLLELLGAGVVIHAPDTRVRFANPKACELLGVSLDQMMGLAAIDPSWRFLRADQSPMPLAEYPVERVIATRQPLREGFVGINLPGNRGRRWVLVNAWPEWDGAAIRQVVVTFVDVTQQRESELRLARMNGTLRSIHRAQHCISREGEVVGMVRGVCDALVQEGGFARAWVVLTERDRAELAAVAGFDRAAGPSGEPMRMEVPATCLVCASSEEASGRGAFPCQCDGCPLAGGLVDVETWRFPLSSGGALGVSVGTRDAVSTDDLTMLAGLALDLGLGIDGVRQGERRRRAEIQHRLSEEKFIKAFEHSPDGIILVEADSGVIVDVNEGFVRMSGYSREELLEQTARGLGLWLEPKAQAQMHEVLRRDGVVRGFSAGGRTKSGRHLHVEVSSALLDIGGRSYRMTTVRDVTAQRSTEEVMHARMRLLEFAGDRTLPEILQRIVDECAAVTDSEVGFYHFVKEDQRTVLLQAWSTRTVAEYCRAEGQGTHYNLDRAGVWADCLRERRPVIVNDYAAHPHKKGLPTGHAPVVRFVVVPIFRNERVVALLGVGNRAYDYTDEDVRLMSYLADFGWEITRRKTVEMEDERLRVQVVQSDRLASMGMLAAGVAHEINNPLTYILFNLEGLAAKLPRRARMLSNAREALREGVGEGVLGADAEALDGAAWDDVTQRLREALDGTRRIQQIARGLGMFSRVESDKLVPVQIGGAVESAITIAHNEIRHRARLVKDLGATAPVVANEGRLSQVFLNLLVNAAHAIREGDAERNRIEVRTWQEGATVVASVEDTGSGIAPELLGRIFEPFFSTKPVGVGTGLGLNIVRNIVVSFGGTIDVTSEPGRGARFVLRLPAAPPTDTPSVKAPVASGDEAAGRARVMVIDDEPAIRWMLQRALRRHDVVAAESGVDAREKLLADDRFDLILCDMMMPEMSGMDLHRWLVAERPELAKRLVFLTGGAFTVEAKEYLDEVQNLQIRKPFEVATILRLAAERAPAQRSG